MKIFSHSYQFSKKIYPIPSQLQLRKIVKTVVNSEQAKPRGELHVVFVDDKKIKQLNRQFLQHNAPTDVIAFPTTPDFGDIYICVPEAKKNAHHYGQSLQCELVRLIIHGLLHLLGYTDHEPKKRKLMWKKQESLVKSWFRK